MRSPKAILFVVFIAFLITACNKESLSPNDISMNSQNIGKDGSIQSGTELLVPSQYSTIQAAVDAAGDGDIIKVSSGTYAEKVVIRDLDNLQIIGNDATITVPSSGMTGTLLKTVNCQNILVKGFTIDGKNGVNVSAGESNGGGDADTRFYGLLAINTSGKIENNFIKDISWHNGVQQGLGMYVYVTDGEAREIHILNNKVTNYNKGGISVRGPLTSYINNNTITHWGETGITAGNGLQVDGGSSNITNNKISGSRYYDENHLIWTAAAILLIAWVEPAISFTVDNNKLSNSDVGVDIYDFGSGLGEISVTNNKFRDNLWDGPYVGPNEDYPMNVHANKYK